MLLKGILATDRPVLGETFDDNLRMMPRDSEVDSSDDLAEGLLCLDGRNVRSLSPEQDARAKIGIHHDLAPSPLSVSSH